MATNTVTVAVSRKHVELSLELKRKLIQEHEHGVPFTLLGKKYHIATSTAANIWRKKDFFLRSRMSGSRKRCNDRSKYKIVNQVTALFVKSMLRRNHKIDGEVIKRFARSTAAQCNFKDFHGSNGWLDSFKKRENVCWVRRRGGSHSNSLASISSSGGGSAIIEHHVPIPSGLCPISGLSIKSEVCILATPPVTAPVSSSTSSSSSSSCSTITSTSNSTSNSTSTCTSASSSATSGSVCTSAVTSGSTATSTSSSSVSLASSTSTGNLMGGPSAGEGCPNRCESPDLSAAVSAALIAITNAHHEHYMAHRQHQFREDRWESEFEFGGFSLSRTCARCRLAAAAGAILALTSGTSIHGRDHDIEDWFQGIPFLCYFFDDYEQREQNKQTIDHLDICAIKANLANLASTHQSICQGHQQSSSLPIAMGQPVGQTIVSCCPSMVKSIKTEGRMLHRSMTASENGNIKGSMSGGNCIVRSLSDAHELMDTSSQQPVMQFKPSASMADIQSISNGEDQHQQPCGNANCNHLQRTMSTDMLTSPQNHEQQLSTSNQQQYEQMKYEPTSNNTSNNSTNANSNNFQQQQQQTPEAVDEFTGLAMTSRSSQACLSDAGDHLMEINFTDETPQQQQQQQLTGCQHEPDQMECILIAKSEPNCCQMGNCGQHTSKSSNEPDDQTGNGAPCTILSSDYNSDDQEFYMQTTRYVPHQDGHDTDDFLYHDEVSDNNDCCSDHYDQSSGGGGGADGSGRIELHLQDYQSDLTNNDASGGSRNGNGCYMSEYEYENISTIRHYPVRMSSMANSNNSTTDGFATNDNDNDNMATTRALIMSRSGSQQQQQQMQHQQLQLSDCQDDQQQAQFNINSGMTNDANQLTDSTGEANCFDDQQQQRQQSSSLQNASDCNGTNDQSSYSSSLLAAGLLHDNEPMIEHADHEDHNLLHNALMRAPDKLKLIDSIVTLIDYASKYNQKMLSPLLEIKGCIERDLEFVLTNSSGANVNGTSSTNSNHHHHHHHHHHHQHQHPSNSHHHHHQTTTGCCSNGTSGATTTTSTTATNAATTTVCGVNDSTTNGSGSAANLSDSTGSAGTNCNGTIVKCQLSNELTRKDKR